MQAAARYECLAAKNGSQADEDLVTEAAARNEDLDFEEGKTRSTIVQVRINQARFRKLILSSYKSTCCISGLHNENLVVASHIVRWSEDTKNRLNPQKGLCLSALHDRAYDQGLITVMPDFTVRISPKIKVGSDDDFITESLLRFDKQAIRLPDRFGPSPIFWDYMLVDLDFLNSADFRNKSTACKRGKRKRLIRPATSAFN